MGLLSFFAGRKAVSASPAVLEAGRAGTFTPVPLIATPPGAAGAIRDAFVEVQSGSYGWIYITQPAVRAVVDYIARNASQLGLHLYQRLDANDRREADNEPAAESVRRPNDATGARRFIYDVMVQLLVYDNAYAVKFAEGDRTRTLIPVPSHLMGLLGQRHYVADGYRVYRPDGTFFDVGANDVIHWRGTDPSDPRQGVSKLETLRLLLAEERAAQESSIQLMKAGLTKPGYLFRPKESPPIDSQEDADRLSEDFKAKLLDIPLLEEGTEWKDLGLSPREAEMLEGRRFTIEMVAAQYGMRDCPPKTMEQRQLFFLDVLQPLLRLFTEVLDVQLVETEYLREDLYFEFALDEAMENEKLKALVSASGRPVLLTDEARAVLDKPPVDGGDQLVTPANVIVGSNPLPSQGVMPIQNPNGPSQEGDFREQALKRFDPNQPRDELGQWSNGGGGSGDGATGDLQVGERGYWFNEIALENVPVTIRKVTKDRYAVETDDGQTYGPDKGMVSREPVPGFPVRGRKGLAPEIKALEVTTKPRREADKRRQERNIDVFEPVIAEHFSRQRQAIKSAGKSNGHTKGLADAARWTKELARDLLRALRLVVDREGGIYVARLGGDDFDLARCDDYLQKMAHESAEGINAATQANIEDMGVDEAFDLAESRIPAVATSFGSRSTTLARKFAGEQSPHPERRQMIWRANTERHQHLDGKAVGLDEDWDGIYPGSEPHCACSADVI